MVKLLLRQGDIQVNQAGLDGDTPLNSAAHMGHHQIVDLLLKRGDIDVNQATTTYGSTPFHRAAQHGDSELTKLLLTRKDVQVNAANKAGDTPLSVAV